MFTSNRTETKSAVERLQISKADYVKSESVLDNDQKLEWTRHLQITTRPHLDTCVQRLKRNLEKNKLRSCRSIESESAHKNSSSTSILLDPYCCCDLQYFGLFSRNLELYHRSLPNLSKSKQEVVPCIRMQERRDCNQTDASDSKTIYSSFARVTDLNDESSTESDPLRDKTYNTLNSNLFNKFNKLETSIIEKNARIIKWLRSCQNYQESC
ncbi:uncharacterized protein [Centruroides vittatus]|uniref:uncharacterized protein n=1 Tax=Centruroides vittatus TaxID=120091 RepID=UPI0035103B61